jgi:hypothetical protein
LVAPFQAVYRGFCDATGVFVGMGSVVVVVVVGGTVVVDVVVVVVVGGTAVVVVGSVVVVVVGGVVGKVVQVFAASGPDAWSAGVVATAAPL